MQTFRTVLPPEPSPFSIAYGDPILSLGSCFAVHIGERLRKYKFSIHNNPFGILYNPVSLLRSVQRLRTGQPVGHDDLFEQHGLWHSFDFHGSFSAADPEAALRTMNDSIRAGRQQLASCRRLILTFGTAFVFEHQAQRRIVANCHKVPTGAFRRYRLGVAEIVGEWLPLLSELKNERPELQVILTVSPVRHLRDGLVENNRSKATLLLAVDELCRQLDFVHYFPAYEILQDDLRDYRFYDRDLSHPNALAVDYVWDFFTETYFEPATRQTLAEIHKLLTSLEHRPLFPGSAAHRQFRQRQLDKAEALQKKYPGLDFSEEMANFREEG